MVRLDALLLGSCPLKEISRALNLLKGVNNLDPAGILSFRPRNETGDICVDSTVGKHIPQPALATMKTSNPFSEFASPAQDV